MTKSFFSVNRTTLVRDIVAITTKKRVQRKRPTIRTTGATVLAPKTQSSLPT